MASAAQRSGALSDGTLTNYGYGLTIGAYRGLTAIGHSGADAEYRAQVEQYPERGIAIAVLCNGCNSSSETLSHTLLRVRRAGETPHLGDGRRLIATSDSSVRIGGTATGLVSRTDSSVVTSLTQVPRTLQTVAYQRQISHAYTPASLTAFSSAYYSDALDARYETSAEIRRM